MSMCILVGFKEPLYKMEMRARREESAHVDEFVLHAALDLVDELMWTIDSMTSSCRAHPGNFGVAPSKITFMPNRQRLMSSLDLDEN
ncbi:unnamed protein product [Peronospora destructor]|uniref:Trafficking protein particle complex subunit n=1 Tax=Peronospora destructor TaxID=86335 RepID=A0AAV0UUQ9_9STRA|nr:unnamed protein product [Peronospora destructor]